LHQNKIINWFVHTVYYIIRLPLMPLNPIKRKPEFLIIGTQKGGTSSLHYLLSQHSDIDLPKKKEIHYFSKYYQLGHSWYHTFFPFVKSSKITGEATPNYLYYTDTAKRVYSYNKNMKLIVLLRDPIQRAISQYHMEFNRGKLNQSFKDLVEMQLKDTKDTVLLDYSNQYTQILHRGKYQKQLKEWYSYFREDQLLILKSEDFFEAPKNILKKVYEFLGLSIQYPENITAKNTGDYNDFELNDGLRKKLLAYFKDDYEFLAQLSDNGFKS